MLGQCWIHSDEAYLAGVAYIPAQKPKAYAIIVPGFSQPACDVDYVMSRIARRLLEEGIGVLQLEPRGHGDSTGMLSDVTLESLRTDIRSGIDYIRNQMDGQLPIYGVGRGLSATLLAEMDIEGVAGASPYCLSKETVLRCFGGMEDTEFEIVEKAGPGETDRRAFFDAAGARETNVYGQIMSTKILHELMEYDALEPLANRKEQGYWLFYDSEKKNNMVQVEFSEDSTCMDLARYADCCMPREAVWQHNVIENMVGWILQKAIAGKEEQGE